MLSRYKYLCLYLAENIAKNYAISRQEQDEYAAKSQQRAEAAIAAGYFKKEIVPVTVVKRKQSIIVSTDEYPKSGTTVTDLEKLRPAFINVINH